MPEGSEPPDACGDTAAVDAVTLSERTECCGTFRFFVDGQRWQWSDAVALMHGYEPGTVPTTELLLRHLHPDDHQRVAAILDRVTKGGLFSSRHRIIDTAGRTHWVVVVGDSMFDDTETLIGTSGFFIDVTEELQSDIKAVICGVTASRDRIEQAKGVLMATYGVSAERAFDVLVWRSQQTNVKVRELSERFLTAIAGTLSAETLTHVDHALLNLEPRGSPRKSKRP
jgi:PAS domain S-box-containing protein